MKLADAERMVIVGQRSPPMVVRTPLRSHGVASTYVCPNCEWGEAVAPRKRIPRIPRELG